MRKFLAALVIPVVALTVVACESGPTTYEVWRDACATGGVGLSIAAEAGQEGKLTPEMIQSISAAKEVIVDLCPSNKPGVGSDEPPTTNQALSSLVDAVADVEVVREFLQ